MMSSGVVNELSRCEHPPDGVETLVVLVVLQWLERRSGTRDRAGETVFGFYYVSLRIMQLT